jgi:hypothetical protein
MVMSFENLIISQSTWMRLITLTSLCYTHLLFSIAHLPFLLFLLVSPHTHTPSLPFSLLHTPSLSISCTHTHNNYISKAKNHRIKKRGILPLSYCNDVENLGSCYSHAMRVTLQHCRASTSGGFLVLISFHIVAMLCCSANLLHNALEWISFNAMTMCKGLLPL